MAHLPKSLSEIPYTPLVFPGPPIIQPLSKLTEHLGSSSPSLWICREDCNSGLAIGGNKVRKLEYVIPEALAEHADTLVTTGGIQSNHMRQTAAVAAKLGLKAVLVPKDMVDPEDINAYNASGNIQVNSLLGAETLPVGTTQEDALQHVRDNVSKPYWIPSGASEHPKGGLGYTRWLCEVAEWERQHGRFFDTIVVTAGGCSTLAGIVVGSHLTEKASGRKRRIIGIGIFDKPEQEMVETTLRIARRTLEKVHMPADAISEEDFRIYMDWNAGAYGRLDDATKHTVQLVARTEGILLDPVYTGKTMTGLVDLVRKGELKDGRDVLFVHTGGQAALPAYPQLR